MLEDREKKLLLKINPEDNVKIVVNSDGLKTGTKISEDFILKEDIPQGHKIALKDIKKGKEIVKYGKVIGYAKENISRGAWIHEERVILPEMPGLDDLTFSTNISEVPSLDGYTFSGYRNDDGTVGTKNMLGLVCCVQCVEGVVNRALEKIKEELLPEFPNVDGIMPVNHTYGCGVAMDSEEAKIPIKTIRNIAKNPNIGEMLVISLGCEKLPPDKLFPEVSDEKEIIVLQEENGYKKMEQKIYSKSKGILERLNRRHRKECSASDLIVGLQCGGSDAFSGVTANPAVGYAADMLVQAGATVVFGEVSEVRDGVDQLAARVINEAVGEKFKEELAWYDKYLSGGNVDRDANPTPGNKEGGLANIVEKALGSIQKSGTTPIRGVLSPGEKVVEKGLIFAATSASDLVCGTELLAAGVNMEVFATGRGTPYGIDLVPVIKISSRTELKDKWADLIDIDAGKIAKGKASHKEVGEDIFQMILDIASGKKEPWVDKFDLNNRICLFDPSVTT